MNNKLMVPTVHMNGTSARELFNQAYKAWTALQMAINTHQEMAPHGRDYYPQGEAAIADATRQYRERAIKMQEVLREIEQIILSVSDKV